MSVWALELRLLYYQIAQVLRNQRPPVLANTDGDPLVMTTLEFELTCTPKEAYIALQPLAGATASDGVAIGGDIGPSGEPQRRTFNWLKRGNRMPKPPDNSAFHNKTPKEAAKTQDGRERLEALLSDFRSSGVLVIVYG